MNKIFGIDLGTNYSRIAYVDEYGKPVVIPNFENEINTPSIVCINDDSSVIVGKEAKYMLETDPEKVVSFIKRNMGDPNYVFPINNIKYKPEEISAYILKKLVYDASENIGIKIKDVVITCPAYFGSIERRAIEIAGEIAGLNVKSIICEPIAAALAYGIDKEQDQTILIYDLGGSTFDITLVQVSHSIEILSTGGDYTFGGKDWDDILIAFLADKFMENTGIKDDILSNVETFGELQIKAEFAKMVLSTRDKTRVHLMHDKENFSIEISREKFEELTKDLANKTIMLTNQLLDDAKAKGFTSFDKILLAGSSTKMPQIRKILEKFYPNIPIESFDPGEAVAKGAAIYGYQLAINGGIIRPRKIKEILEKELINIQIDIAMAKNVNKRIVYGSPLVFNESPPTQVTFKISDAGQLDIQAVGLTGNKEFNLNIKTSGNGE